MFIQLNLPQEQASLPTNFKTDRTYVKSLKNIIFAWNILNLAQRLLIKNWHNAGKQKATSLKIGQIRHWVVVPQGMAVNLFRDYAAVSASTVKNCFYGAFSPGYVWEFSSLISTDILNNQLYFYIKEIMHQPLPSWSKNGFTSSWPRKIPPKFLFLKPIPLIESILQVISKRISGFILDQPTSLSGK